MSETNLPAATYKRLLVTAALPYANGSLHIGHLIEYILADIYVRAHKAMGVQAHLICANDAHGTPIELNASRQGITPEVLVARYHKEHQEDFARFGVAFDIFDITHSDANRQVVLDAYAALQARGFIEKRPLEGNFCETDARFLPDRFVKGTCPKCQATEQYGDVCERCGATYAPTDLIAPKCVLCGNPPIRKMSEHAFFKLSKPEMSEFLRTWIDAGTLQADVANYVRNWIDGGLKDWCISRDGPYFGFPIPDMDDKYFYVWLDAPFGYVSASENWGKAHGLGLDELWRSDDTRIEHIIGKDIMYFHTLFWPAVLQSIGMNLPSKVHVHGMLTVDGEKMSKSRGTFIRASVFAEHIEPEALRYYNASKYTPESRDIDLSFADFVARVNGELINKHVNLFSRLARFVHARLDGKLEALPFTAEQAHSDTPAEPGSWLALAQRTIALAKEVELAYRGRDIARATRLLSDMADGANEAMQAHEPWKCLPANPQKAQEICSVVAAVAEALIVYLQPIVPQLAEKAARIFAIELQPMHHGRLFQCGARTLAPFERLMERLEAQACTAVVTASQDSSAAPQADAQTQDDDSKQAAPLKPQISIDALAPLDLRVGTIVAAEALPKSKKLLQLQVDLGEAQPRQILAGLAQAYAAEDLLGKQVIVVANLKPAKIMGVQSCGMVLASDGADGLPCILQPAQQQPAGASVH